jgi:hypothetical protein
VVNLSESSSFVKVTILVEYDKTILEKFALGGEGGGHGGGAGGGGGEEKPNAIPPEMMDRDPVIRDAIIRVLSGKRAADVLSASGKEILKEELMEAINEAMGMEEPPIVAVYFTEFIVQ